MARDPLGEFNSHFLGWLIGFAAVAVVFVFYFNRIVAYALFTLIRTYTWIFYRVDIKCQAIQFSLLAGRIFLRGLSYHGENETILIHQVYVTWQYWYRRVAHVDVRPSEKEHVGPDSSSDLSGDKSRHNTTDKEGGQDASRREAKCRISAQIRGVEWFVYNRSPAYDGILASAARTVAIQSQERPTDSRWNGKIPNLKESDIIEGSKIAGSSVPTDRASRSSAREKPLPDPPFFLRLLPIYVECSKAAMVMGNQHTRSVLVAKIEHAKGHINAHPSGPLDVYRQAFEFDMTKLMMQFIPNEDYVEPLLTAGARLNGVDDKVSATKDEARDKKHHKVSRHKARHALGKLIPQFQRSVESFDRRSASLRRGETSLVPDLNVIGLPRWIGLTRYLDEEEEDQLEHDRWQAIEYAEDHTIANFSTFYMNFYWDVPGYVGSLRERSKADLDAAEAGDINGSVPPEWTLELRLGGGTVQYGPWADRQRVDFMTVFFPAAYMDTVPALPLRTGQVRISTVFKILIALDGKVELRLLTREPSKDWKYKGLGQDSYHAVRPQGGTRQGKASKQLKSSFDPSSRPSGCLTVSVAANTTVTYNMDMLARKVGFKNDLSVDVVSPEIQTSVNQDVLLRSSSMKVSADISNPLGWNAHRTWRFDISLKDTDLFLLREHTFLIQDLVEDFTLGPPSDFHTFVPFVYDLRLDFDNLKLLLNANEANIIDEPTDLSLNTFLALEPESLRANVKIPAHQLSPEQSKISFDGTLTNTIFRMLMPTWSTYHSLSEKNAIGRFPQISADGYYNYFAESSPANTDTLVMNIHGDGPEMYLYGFLIRYFLHFQENYFGKDVHFQTLEEYQGRLEKPGRKHAEDNEHKPVKPSSDLDVVLAITTSNASILLPSTLYANASCVKLDLQDGHADLRFTNYYMDLQTAISPVSVSHFLPSSEDINGRDLDDTGVQAFIDGITITGHRLFGLPPAEPTYACNWDFDVGDITGESSVDFLGALASGVQAFIYGFDDKENALPGQEEELLSDVTFIRASINPVRLWLLVDQAAFLCELSESRVEFNDWARQRFSQRLFVTVPNIVLAAVGRDSAIRKGSRNRKATTYGYLQTSLDLRMVQSNANFLEEQKKQQEHLHLHDTRTVRTPWLIGDRYTHFSDPQHQSILAKLQPPASQYPQIPAPVGGGTHSSSSSLRTQSGKSALSTKKLSSFLIRPESRGQVAHQKIDEVDEAPPRPGLRLIQPSSDSVSRTRTAARGKIPARGHAATLTSSYGRPHFSFHGVQPSPDDVPEVRYSEADLRKSDRGDAKPDELPYEDDGIIHVSFMVTMDAGLRVMCTPLALEGINRLLATVIGKEPDVLLDGLQIRSLEGVAAARRPNVIPKSTQFRVGLPCAAIRLRHHLVDKIDSGDGHQVYELALKDLILFGRLGAERPPPLGKTPSSIHASLSKLEIEARRSSDANTSDAQVIGRLDDLTLWAHEAEEVVGELQFRSLEIASLNRKIEHLATLVNQAGSLADHLGSAFQMTVMTQEARLQFLIYELMKSSGQLPDPLMLNNSSFISRSSGEHVRASDSWKMLMRLRWIWRSLDQEASRLLSRRCQQDLVELPISAQSHVVSAYDEWRGWDLNNLGTCAFMRELYGKAVPVDQPPPAFPKPIKVALLSEIIVLAIDPAQKGNRILAEGLAIAVDSHAKRVGEADVDLLDTDSTRKSVVGVTCDRFSAEMRLELLEAVQGIFTHVKTIEASQHLSQPPLPKPVKPAFARHEIQAAIVVKKNDLRLRTQNLNTTLRADVLSASVIANQVSRSKLKLSALISSRTSSLELLSHSRPTLKILLALPTLQLNLDKCSEASDFSNIWGVGVNCLRVNVDISESVLGLLALVDRMINQELIYLQQFVRKVRQADTPAETVSIEPKAVNTINMSLEVRSYYFTAAIFSSLKYRLEGKGIRSSLVPHATSAGANRLDIDIRDHTHGIFNEADGNILEIAKLALPPINAEVDIRQGRSGLVLGLDVHVSVINIDASALHGLFSTLSRSEIKQFSRDLSRDVGIVRANLDAVTASLEPASPSPQTVTEHTESNGEVRYSAHVNLDGVQMRAYSTNTLKTSAELTVDSGPIKFSLSNEEAGTGAIVQLPHVDLYLNAIEVTLESIQNGRRAPCGKIVLSFSVIGRSEISDGKAIRSFGATFDALNVDIYTETASMIIDILGFLQQKFKRFNMKEEIQTIRAKRRKRTESHAKSVQSTGSADESNSDAPAALFDAIIAFQLRKLQVAWRVTDTEAKSSSMEPEDLIFSIAVIDLRTKKGNTARLEIKDLQLQLVPQSQLASARSNNSALLPEVVFRVAYLSTSKQRRLAFQALGKALNLRLTSHFILPLSNIQKSIAVATTDLRAVLADWNETFVDADSEQKSILGNKKLTSLIVDADFDGAVVYMEGRDASDRLRDARNRMSRHGRLGQYEDKNSTTLTSPGLAFKIEYQDTPQSGPSLGAEVKIAASENKLQPMFVPLVLEVASSIKELVGRPGEAQSSAIATSQNLLKETPDEMPDPTAILGDCKLSLGFRICEQSFSLTCEPIAKVTATAKFDDIYITVSTVQPNDGTRFFAVSSAITGLEATVKHVYSREPTGRFDVKSINLSMMNSEHVNGTKGISSILNVSPMTIVLNVKQLQDFLTFREIWYPVEIRPVPQPPAPTTDQNIGGVQRYYQATATNSFSWNAAINIAGLELQLDLGQSVGRLSFSITKLWVVSRKDSAQEQNLCLGFESIGIQSKGRMSGSVELRDLRLRTSIIWPGNPSTSRTPLVQASLNFRDLQARAAFDYQTFAVADFQSLDFLLYNTSQQDRDRLICTVDGGKIHAYCTANVAAQTLALYQAVDRLLQEKLTAFELTLKQMERFQRQKAAAGLGLSVSQELPPHPASAEGELTPVRLQVNVVVSLNALKVGVYPRAFTDNQIFKLEALDALARFGVNIDDGATHTLLTVVLGQVRVALSHVGREQRPKALGDISIEDVVKDSIASRGGTILKVPRVVATMQTWQPLHTKKVEYIFSSTFEGKVEVGWNYARISFIRNMWETHSKVLEQRLGKPLPQSAVQITSTPRPDAADRGRREGSESGSEQGDESKDKENQSKELITAVVNVPLSKYTYVAREPPVIQTPQLRDMGEATPPLEWIGLQREKLPNLTHQVVIVPLLEFAKEVEDAYGKILGAR